VVLARFFELESYGRSRDDDTVWWLDIYPNRASRRCPAILQLRREDFEARFFDLDLVPEKDTAIADVASSITPSCQSL
jgi:hypothetical protein